MAKNAPIRAMSLGTALARRMCTAAAAAEHKPLYRRLAALGGVPGGSVAETMKEWLREGGVATQAELMKIVKEQRKYKNYKHALELIDWMFMRGMNMCPGEHAVRLGLISKVKGIDEAESYFSSLPEVAKNRTTYGALLNSYCQGKMVDKAVALYEKMKDLNIASSSLIHNNLMTLYMKVGEPKKVHTQLQEMKAANISPDEFTYCLLMNSYASLNDINSVERVVQEMREEGKFVMDWTIYCNLAGHYNSAGLFDKAESALKTLEAHMDRRDRMAYHFLISLYAAAGNLAEVTRVWKLLKAQFEKATNMSYLNMLQALRKLDELDALKQCFEEWEHVHVNYDIRLVNVVIDVYLRKGMIEEAEALWKEAVKKNKGSDLRTLNMFTDYYLKARKIDSALNCLEDATHVMKQNEWKPDKEKVKEFLVYFEEAKDVDGAEALCKILKKLKCLDTEGYESLLRIYLAAGRKVPSLLERIKEDGIEISSETEKLIERVCMC